MWFITKYLWLILLGISVYFLIKSMQQSMAQKNATKVIGTIINHEITTIGNGIFLYYPIYEYTIDNETFTTTSPCYQFKPLKLGTQGVIYYDVGRRTAFEASACITRMTLAVIFAAISIALMFIQKLI